MASSDESQDDVLVLDDYSSLSHREMIETVTKQLHALRDIANSNPAVTEETMEAIEDALEQYISDVAASEEADQALAIPKPLRR
ncbi:MAG TPA: hypothetical protein VFZ49_09580 [Pyrinomonadaceae bacterium]